VVEPHGNAIRFEQTWNADKPKGASDFFVSTSSGLFTSMRMQQAYVSSTFTGVLMALGLALGSLMVFVGNVVVALLAFLCIASVVCCTLGTMVLLGWSLGAIEAICAVVVVGFAVDFCAHLAIAYAEAPERTRAERVTRALASVGISVMSGAITTLGASALLFATTIQYLFKFGVFMMMTVGFSVRMRARLAPASLALRLRVYAFVVRCAPALSAGKTAAPTYCASRGAAARDLQLALRLAPRDHGARGRRGLDQRRSSSLLGHGGRDDGRDDEDDRRRTT